MLRIFVFVFFLFTTLISSASAAKQIVSLVKFQKKGFAKVLYVGEIDLSAEGYWTMEKRQISVSDAEIYFIRDSSSVQRETGRRLKQIDDKQKNMRGAILSQFYRPLIDFALSNNNITPTSLDELDKKRYAHLFKTTDSMWSKETEKVLQGKYIYLIPSVKLDIDPQTKRVITEERKILLFELQPYLDDGRHWVLYSDGSCVREKVDNKFLAQYGQIIQPVIDAQKAQTEEKPSSYRYKVVALLPEKFAAPFSIHIANVQTGQKIELITDPAKAEEGGGLLFDDLKTARMLTWRPYILQGDPGTPIQAWYRINDKKGFDRLFSQRQGAMQRQGAELSVFGLLGGRGAVEETLQLQEIRPRTNQPEEEKVPVSTIASVTVKSHPFDEMLGDKTDQQLSLAKFAPADRFFVYTSQPTAILPFLDEGAQFISDFGGVLCRSGITYNLKQKYLKRLGLDNKWLEMFINSGAVKETALLFPDLFFIDGTDVTVISRLNSAGIIGSLIKLVGITGLTAKNVVTKVLPGNNQVFWAMRGDILIISTSRQEMQDVLTLYENQGAGSLGTSAEFRYMLTQLSHTDKTRFYAYFSDPFIRRLVGPATKIGQRRRIEVRRDLETITSGALLAKLDGFANPVSLEALAREGYIPKRLATDDYSIDETLAAHSRVYGSVQSLRTLNDAPVVEASLAEADAYKQYVDNYNRYWRRFFDPIALRIEDQQDGSLETTLFILPLIDNTIYNTLREILAAGEDESSLRVPVTDSPPVTMLSLNLREKQWLEISKHYLDSFRRYTLMSPTFLDDLGPGMHLAIHDADPVIALGSGDILGAFGGDSATAFRGGGALMIPAALSLLTRPCTLFIETADPEKTKMHLQRASSYATRMAGRGLGGSASFYQLDGRDEWVYSFDLFGLVKLRYGIEIQGDYLVIRNIPWAKKDTIRQVSKVELNGAVLQAFPGACKTQLQSLFTSAHEDRRNAAMKGMAYLYPIVTSGHADIDSAADKHLQLYGFRPAHPGKGNWLWEDREIKSSLYGSPRQQKQPVYAKGDTDFGLFKGIEFMSLNMQFEDAGLRSKIRWKLK